MNNQKTDRFSWQFRLEDFANNACKGVRLIAARKGSSGRWLAYDQLPAYVRDYFLPEVRAGVTFVGDYADIAALLEAVGDGGDGSPQTDAEGHVVWGKGTPGSIQGAVCLREPDVAALAQKVPALPGFRSGDGTKWGISDFYDDKETALRAALASGQDFTTGWYGSKKEIASGCVSRVGDQVLCQASVSDDFDCEGTGEVVVRVGRKQLERLVEAIQSALDQALAEARQDQKGNSCVRLWSVRNRKGAWVETYLEPTGWADPQHPPGDNYQHWGWQGDGARVPRKVKEAFEAWLGGPERLFTLSGWTVSSQDD